MTFAPMSKSKTKPVASRKSAAKHKPVPNRSIVESLPGLGGLGGRSAIAPTIQPKLKVGEPNDKFEQEADRVADQVMRMPDRKTAGTTLQKFSDLHTRTTGISLSIQRLCSECEEQLQKQLIEKEEETFIQSKKDGGGTKEASSKLDARVASLQSGGKPLPHSLRTFFEPRFGQDFSQVRIHTDSSAASTAQTLNARAFTTGQNIVFGSGEYQPHSSAGRHLFAHELAHVVQQTGSTSNQHSVANQKTESQTHAGVKIAQTTLEPSLQRVCGSAAIGTPVGCTGESSEPIGERVLFQVNCDDFQLPAEEQKVKDFADSMSDSDKVNVHGFASTDGPADFNDNLSCARAQRTASVLETSGISPAQISVLKHGPTPGPARERRSVVLELDAGVSRPVVPQLSANISVGPTPGICGAMNFVIQWQLSRNSAVNGGFVMQDITFIWDVRDCTGATVPNPDPRTSPLRYFEAWRVAPNSQTFSPVSTDTFFWPGSTPWAGGCTDGEVSISAVARYHDDVPSASMPAHMTVGNPATFAGGLQSSLTDPNLGGNISRPVPHRLRFHWVCCPCQSSPTIIDEQIPT